MACNLFSWPQSAGQSRRLKPRVGWMFALAALCGSILTGNVLHADDSNAVRKQRLESLSASEKGKLLEKKKRFYALDPKEQQRIKNLHRDHSENSNSQRLHEISVSNSHWLGRLSSRRRAKL